MLRLRGQLCVVGLGLLLTLTAQAACAVTEALKIEVKRDGMYRLGYDALAKAGVPLAGLTPARIGLSSGGKPVARRLALPPSGVLGPGADVIFYGQGLDTRWTDTNVYWLTWDGTNVADMKPLPPGPQEAPEITSFPSLLHLEERHEYLHLMATHEEGELQPWVWKVTRAGAPDTTNFDLPHLVAGKQVSKLRVMLRGKTADPTAGSDHHVLIAVNGRTVAEGRSDDQACFLLQASLPAGLLREAGNALTIRVPGDSPLRDRDQVALHWIEVEYPRGLAYDGGGLRMAIAAGADATARVTGVPAETLDLYDVSNPAQPRAATGLLAQSGVATVPLAAGEARALLAVTAGDYLKPAAVRQPAAVDLRAETNGADYIIIAHDGFVDAVRSLAEHRAKQGLRVRVVPVGAVYDEFSHGVFTPVAIRDFLWYTHEHWAEPAPRYALLVGDANYDYRDYLGTGVRNYVPAYPVRVEDSVETPTDTFYVCFSEKSRAPQMAIGRLPVRTADQAGRLCQRIVAYERTPPPGDWRRRALIVADHELPARTATWFERSSEQDARYCETFGMQAERVYLRQAGISPDLPADQNQRLVREQTTPLVTRGLEAGCALFLFQGHGAAGYLGRQRVLEVGDLDRLDNQGRSPIAVLVTCFAGAFDDPECQGGQCLAERLLEAPSGAVACVAPTRLGGPNIEAPFLGRLLAAPATSIGETLVAAKSIMAGRRRANWEQFENYNLLGDPLTVAQIEVQAPPPPPGETPAEDGLSDTDANRIADLTERHIAEGTYQRYGLAEEKKIALYVEFNGRPTRENVAAVERLGGYVLDVAGPPWAMEVSLPLLNVAPLTRTVPNLVMVRESRRYGCNVQPVRVDEPGHRAPSAPIERRGNR